MIVEWWELVVLALSCSLAGWWGARRHGAIVYAREPIPMSKFTINNIREGDPFRCDGCHQWGHVSVMTDPVVNLTCACGHSTAVRG